MPTWAKRSGKDSVSKFISLLISGIVSGAIYSMLAAGLTLTYTTTGIFNLSYGAIAFTCVFVYFELQNGLGLAERVGRHRRHFGTGATPRPASGPLRLPPTEPGQRRLQIMATVGVLVAVPALASSSCRCSSASAISTSPMGRWFRWPRARSRAPKQWHQLRPELRLRPAHRGDRRAAHGGRTVVAAKHTSIGLNVRALV